MLLTGQATKRLPKSKVTSSREPPAPARACAGQRRRDTRGGGTVGDQQGQEGASRRLRRRSRRTTAPKDGPGHPTLACDHTPLAHALIPPVRAEEALKLAGSSSACLLLQ